MKKIAPLILSMLLVFFNACTKNNKTSDTPTEKSDLKEIGAIVSTVKCSGKCAEDNNCRFKVYPGIQFGECNCTGCTLIVDTDYGGDNLIQDDPAEFFAKFFSKETFLYQFERYLQEKHGTSQYSLNSIEHGQFGKDYYIIYDYTTSNDSTGTVMYFNTAGNKTQIECEGITTIHSQGSQAQTVPLFPGVYEHTAHGA